MRDANKMKPKARPLLRAAALTIAAVSSTSCSDSHTGRLPEQQGVNTGGSAGTAGSAGQAGAGGAGIYMTSNPKSSWYDMNMIAGSGGFGVAGVGGAGAGGAGAGGVAADGGAMDAGPETSDED